MKTEPQVIPWLITMECQIESMRGQITSRDETGRTIVLHTDERAAQSFFALINCIAAGREELGLLLHSTRSPEAILRRTEDARSDQELRMDWITKVTNEGLHLEVAEVWLDKRIRIHHSDPSFCSKDPSLEGCF